jgi:hypothetical protein
MHFFHLYRVNHKEITLLSSERTWEPLVLLLATAKVNIVHILDNTTSHCLKVESVSQSLRLHEYLQWCWQKWCHVRQNTLFATMRLLRGHNSVLTGTSPSALPLLGLWEQLEQQSIACTMSSYPLALIFRIYELYGTQWNALTPPLLVIVDKEGYILLAFLLKGKLVTVRHYTLSNPQDIRGVLPKNIIMDTVKYVEKNFNIHGVTPLFFLEDTPLEPVFRELFPNSTFYGTPINQSIATPVNSNILQRSTLTITPSAPQFDLLILSKLPRAARMQLQGGFLHSRFRGLKPYIKLLTLITMLITIYAMYSAFHLMLVNQKLSQKLENLNHQAKKTALAMAKNPFSSSAIKHIQSICTQSEHQYTQINTYIKLLEEILNNRHVMRSLSIGAKKSRCFIAETDAGGASTDDLIDMGKNAFPDFEVINPKNSNSHLFAIETKSPFFYEKNSH